MFNIINFENTLPISPIESIILFLISLFFCILFLQSGFDKVFHVKVNLDFLKSHFNKTIFQNYINILFVILSFLELMTGLIFTISLIGVILFGFSYMVVNFMILGLVLANLTICSLFLGQRIANDYVGASNLAIYFLVSLFGLLVVL